MMAATAVPHINQSSAPGSLGIVLVLTRIGAHIRRLAEPGGIGAGSTDPLHPSPEATTGDAGRDA